VNAMMVIPSPLVVVVPHLPLQPVAVSTHLHLLPVATAVAIAETAMTANVFNAKKLMNTYARKLLTNMKNANKF
jgi:hypothetical protein